MQSTTLPPARPQVLTAADLAPTARPPVRMAPPPSWPAGVADDGALKVQVVQLLEQINSAGAAPELARTAARSCGLLNEALAGELAADRIDVLPLVNGYVLYRDPTQDGRFRAAVLSDFLATAGPDGALAGMLKPATLDLLADYVGDHVRDLDQTFPQALRNLRSEIAQIAREVNPHAEVRVVDRLYGGDDVAIGPLDGGRRPLLGLWFENLKVLAVSQDLQRGDPVETAYHELYHSIEGLLNPEERRVVEQAFGRAGENGYNERAAESFAKWAGSRFFAKRAGEKPPAGMGTVARFVERLRNAVEGNGFRTWEDVYEEALKGRIAERTKTFDVTAKLPAREAAKIARAAGLEKLADTYEAYASFNTRWTAAPRKAARAMLGRLFGTAGKAKDDKGPPLTGEQLYRSLRRYLPDRDIREAVASAGYNSIRDGARVTGLLLDRDAQLEADLATATQPTPVRLDQPRAAARGGTPDYALRAAPPAPGAVREPWQKGFDEFVASEALLRQSAQEENRFGHKTTYETFAWPAAAPRYTVRVDNADIRGDERAAARVFHRQAITEALKQGLPVPPSAAADYPDLHQRAVAAANVGIDSAARPGAGARYTPQAPGTPRAGHLGVGRNPDVVVARAPAGGPGAGQDVLWRPAPQPHAPEPTAAATAGLRDAMTAEAKAASLEAYGRSLDDTVLAQRLRAAETAHQPRLLLDVPDERRPEALQLGARVDAATRLLFVPPTLAEDRRDALLNRFDDYETALARRQWLVVQPGEERLARDLGARHDRVADGWYVDPRLEEAAIRRLESRFSPTDRQHAGAIHRARDARRGEVLYSLGQDAVRRREDRTAPRTAEAGVVEVRFDPRAVMAGAGERSQRPTADFAAQMEGLGMPAAAVRSVDAVRGTVSLAVADRAAAPGGADAPAARVAAAAVENPATVGAAAGAAGGPVAPPTPSAALREAAVQPFYAPADPGARGEAALRARGLAPDDLAQRLTATQALAALFGRDPAKANQVAELKAGAEVLTAETHRRERAARGRALGRGME